MSQAVCAVGQGCVIQMGWSLVWAGQGLEGELWLAEQLGKLFYSGADGVWVTVGTTVLRVFGANCSSVVPHRDGH